MCWRRPGHWTPAPCAGRCTACRLRQDLVNVAGLRSTHGSPIFADLVPDTDDVLAANLRAAGAILIGKTNVPEFGLGSHTFNPVYGRTTNPYDPARTCGGSSGRAGSRWRWACSRSPTVRT